MNDDKEMRVFLTLVILEGGTNKSMVSPTLSSSYSSHDVDVLDVMQNEKR